ncbi:MAG TPA: SprT-like domain-containing protein [Nevskiales bacterium]|nr:SprT-like domain-containing protein [Nevskiales bacterium]
MLDYDSRIPAPDNECALTPAAELEQRARDAVLYWLQQAERLAAQRGLRLAAMPRLAFDLRGLNAGEFIVDARRYGGPCIRINRELLQRHPQQMLDQVVPHEVAHYVVWALWPGRTRPHGREWRAVMRHFGKPPEVSHRMAARPSRHVRRLPFTCGCEAPQLCSLTIYRRHLAGVRYYCRRCKQRLRPAPDAVRPA